MDVIAGTVPRFPFGLTVSSKILQKRLHQALEGVETARCIADDVLIWGRTDDEHDERVRSFLQCRCEIGIALNKDKCRFGLQEIPFMGHVLSSSGLKPDPAKIEAIVKMKPPTDKTGVERLRGTVNYLSRFVPKLSDVIRPISDLIHPMLSGPGTLFMTKLLKKPNVSQPKLQCWATSTRLKNCQFSVMPVGKA